MVGSAFSAHYSGVDTLQRWGFCVSNTAVITF